jgi:hypothetical protein
MLGGEIVLLAQVVVRDRYFAHGFSARGPSSSRDPQRKKRSEQARSTWIVPACHATVTRDDG